MTRPPRAELAVRPRPRPPAVRGPLQVGWLDRLIRAVAPTWGLKRIRSRAAAEVVLRHYEAAQQSWRTANWYRSASNADSASRGGRAALREIARDLRRNNEWAANAIRILGRNVVGHGITASATANNSRTAAAAQKVWQGWSESLACDWDGRLNFGALQRLVMETVVEAGECLIVKMPATLGDNLPAPIRLRVLEPDYLSPVNDVVYGQGQGITIDGIEYDALGRRVAYWMYTSHPGSAALPVKLGIVRVPASDVIHVYRVDRPEQKRGVSWLAPLVTTLQDLDDFEQAELMKQKVAACLGVLVTDLDGTADPAGDSDADPTLETLQPGQIQYLPGGKQISVINPPSVVGTSYTPTQLRKIAAGLGITYEELSDDYSGVNFSSARMARLAAWANVLETRSNMLIPQLCAGVWSWVMRSVAPIYRWGELPGARWVAPPMPMLDPDKEAAANQKLVRTGGRTLFQMIQSQGGDPIAHLDEIQRVNEELDRRGIVLDTDPRRVTITGQEQAGAPGAPEKQTANG